MPGLTAALCEACKRSQDDIERVWRGEAVADLLTADRRVVASERERAVLAAFALGGGAGMPWSGVARALDVSALELREMTAGLGAGGVVADAGEGRLRVRPEVLGAVLVRDVFFAGAGSLDPAPLLAIVPSRQDTAHVLMRARQRGAPIDLAWLESYVAGCGYAVEAWKHFAWVDPACARAILERHPEHVAAAARGLLESLPDETLSLLLAGEVGDKIDVRQAIERWLVRDEMETGTSLDRRRLLVDAAAAVWKSADSTPATAARVAWALGAALKPDFENHRTSPGNQYEVVLTHGLIPFDDLKGLAELWPEVLALLQALPGNTWTPLLDRIDAWCLPQRFLHRLTVPAETEQFIRDMGQRMVEDLLRSSGCTRIGRTWAAQLNDRADLGLTVAEDPLVSVLFEAREHHPELDWRAATDRRHEQLRRTAAELAVRTPAEVVGELAQIEREAAAFGKLHGGYDRVRLYGFIAEAVADLFPWIKALVSQQMQAQFVMPFLQVMGQRDHADTWRLLKDLLAQPLYEKEVIAYLLRDEKAPEELLDQAVQRLEPPPRSRDEHWMVGWQLPLESTRRLLAHPTAEIRAAAALSERNREHPAGQVRPEVLAAWREAVLEIGTGDHYLADILGRDPELTFKWVEQRLRRGGWRSWLDGPGVANAMKGLPPERRLELVMLVTGENYTDERFDALVGDDAELYGRWFAEQTDEWLKFRPLHRVAGPRWENRALAVLDRGATPGQVADHCIPMLWGGSGSRSDYFRSLLPVYEQLSNHPDHRLRPAGERGLAWVRSNLQQAIELERRDSDEGW